MLRRTLTTMARSLQASIEAKLSEALKPSYLAVLNESHMHNVPKDSETHFKVVVVSEQFEGVKVLERHRLVNKLLADELEGGVHALSIKAKTPQQWEKSGGKVDESPKCRGGSKA